jgi:hypothetical protein
MLLKLLGLLTLISIVQSKCGELDIASNNIKQTVTLVEYGNEESFAISYGRNRHFPGKSTNYKAHSLLLLEGNTLLGVKVVVEEDILLREFGIISTIIATKYNGIPLVQMALYKDDFGPTQLIATSNITKLEATTMSLLPLNKGEEEIKKGSYWIMTIFDREVTMVGQVESNKEDEMAYVPMVFGSYMPSAISSFQMKNGESLNVFIMGQRCRVRGIYSILLYHIDSL